MTTNFLITCGGGPGIIAIMESLEASSIDEMRVILADTNPAAGNLYLPEVDARYQIPAWDAPHFIKSLLKLVEKEKIDYIYSGLDEELPILSENKERFEAKGCLMLLPKAEALRCAWNKLLTYKKLDGLVQYPEIYDGNNEILNDFYLRHKGHVLIKLTKSRGGRGIYLPKDLGEFIHLAEYLDRDKGLSKGEFIIQRLVHGHEYNIATLHDLNRRCIYAFSRRKFEARLIKSSTLAAVVERNDELIEVALTAISNMELDFGFNNVEIIVEDETPYLIEINGGRTAAQDLNIVASGICITDLMIKILRNDHLDRIEHIPDGKASLKIRKDVIVEYADIATVESI